MPRCDFISIHFRICRSQINGWMTFVSLGRFLSLISLKMDFLHTYFLSLRDFNYVNPSPFHCFPLLGNSTSLYKNYICVTRIYESVILSLTEILCHSNEAVSVSDISSVKTHKPSWNLNSHLWFQS